MSVSVETCTLVPSTLHPSLWPRSDVSGRCSGRGRFLRQTVPRRQQDRPCAESGKPPRPHPASPQRHRRPSACVLSRWLQPPWGLPGWAVLPVCRGSRVQGPRERLFPTRVRRPWSPAGGQARGQEAAVCTDSTFGPKPAFILVILLSYYFGLDIRVQSLGLKKSVTSFSVRGARPTHPWGQGAVGRKRPCVQHWARHFPRLLV